MLRKLTSGFVVLALVAALLAGCQTGPTPSADQIGASPMPTTRVDALLGAYGEDDTGLYGSMAAFAVNDLIGHYWSKDHIIPTWEGYSYEGLPDARGGPWEAGMFLFTLYDMWVLTGDDLYKDYLLAQEAYVRKNYLPGELEAAGEWLHWAADDCGWNAMIFLNFYTVTEDMYWVERAINLLDNVVERWYDPDMGGIRYSDGVIHMAMYEVSICLDWLRIWEITGEQRFYDLALRSYNAMQKNLGREDGLYFCEGNAYWPFGNIDQIGEAGSASFLGGNLGMAALSAKFYKITGDQVYLDRVYQTNQGLLTYYVREDGTLLNDRDAWTNGTFTAFYVSEVLSLPDTEEMQQAIKTTALSILRNARTVDGYYGGSWSGPAEGKLSTWWLIESKPQQIMTSSSSVLMITAAALLEAGVTDYVR